MAIADLLSLGLVQQRYDLYESSDSQLNPKFNDGKLSTSWAIPLYPILRLQNFG